ncbi:MAG: HYR domain-containing protein [Saprospiraceae bacterium]
MVRGTVEAWNAVSATDNCGTIKVTQSPVATTPLNGHNDVETVTLTADDGNGNTADCSFTVTLKDITDPVITCQ